MDGLAIERQREDCEAIAKQRGWMVVYPLCGSVDLAL